MAPPSYLPNGIWSNHHRCDEVDRLKQSNQIHKGVCSHSDLSQLQPTHKAGQTLRIFITDTLSSPSLLAGLVDISSLFYTDFNTQNRDNNIVPSSCPCFLKSINAWMQMKSRIFSPLVQRSQPPWQERGGGHEDSPSKFSWNRPGQSLMDWPPWRTFWKWLIVLSSVVIQCKTLQG